MDHRKGQWVFAIVVGLAVAVWSYVWITDPARRTEREAQEAVVLAARQQLLALLPGENVDVVDPVAPRRSVGKVYVYRIEHGWQVSGYFRRGEGARWHSYLIELDPAYRATHIKLDEKALAARFADNPLVEVVR